MLVSEYAAYLLECAAKYGDRELVAAPYLATIDSDGARLSREMLPNMAADHREQVLAGELLALARRSLNGAE